MAGIHQVDEEISFNFKLQSDTSVRQSSSYDEDDTINYTLSKWDILGMSNVSHSETIQEMT